MIRKLLVIMTVVASITNSAEGSPHGHNDPYKPVIRLLKEIRKQRKYGGSGFSPIREGDGGLFGSASNSQFQFPSNFNGYNNGGGNNGGGNNGGNNGGGNGGGSGGGSPPNPILTPGSGSSGSSGIGSFIPPAAGGSSNYPPIFPTIPSGSQIAGQLGVLPPYPLEQVNRGVGTILQGVRSLDLGQILRGAFIFPRNENVRSVANNVIDNIFGAIKPPSG
ncbi:hypothetical protein Ocin01_09347 [Orchesella cincta]|uniref:Uncharacterized protein n=1 Tax=Orchesella cincta TaxID=48709 RepID=A0A1D2MWA5_ORCCI|nr:hypothetical protein Ocin01_09347 [Orchesella cincta]